MLVMYLFKTRVIFLLKAMLKRQEKTMAKIDELKDAVVTLSASVNAAVAKIDELKAQGNNDAAIGEVLTTIKDVTTRLDQASA